MTADTVVTNWEGEVISGAELNGNSANSSSTVLDTCVQAETASQTGGGSVLSNTSGDYADVTAEKVRTGTSQTSIGSVSRQGRCVRGAEQDVRPTSRTIGVESISSLALGAQLEVGSVSLAEGNVDLGETDT